MIKEMKIELPDKELFQIIADRFGLNLEDYHVASKIGQNHSEFKFTLKSLEKGTQKTGAKK